MIVKKINSNVSFTFLVCLFSMHKCSLSFEGLLHFLLSFPGDTDTHGSGCSKCQNDSYSFSPFRTICPPHQRPPDTLPCQLIFSSTEHEGECLGRGGMLAFCIQSLSLPVSGWKKGDSHRHKGTQLSPRFSYGELLLGNLQVSNLFRQLLAGVRMEHPQIISSAAGTKLELEISQ